MRSERHVIFDFDWTMIDANSDVFIFEKLNPDLLLEMKRLQESVQWTDLMQQLIDSLLTTKKIADVEQCLSGCPFEPEMAMILSGLNSSSISGDESQSVKNVVSIVSDANQFFIETILKHHRVNHLVHQIYTNPALVHCDNNSLHLTHYCAHINVPHQCLTCPVNMCKGEIIERLISQEVDQQADSNETFIVYVGDGSNDFCAAKRLGQNDLLFARRGYRLEKHILQSEEKLRCKVEYWSNWKELLSLFEHYKIVAAQT